MPLSRRYTSVSAVGDVHESTEQVIAPAVFFPIFVVTEARFVQQAFVQIFRAVLVAARVVFLHRRLVQLSGLSQSGLPDDVPDKEDVPMGRMGELLANGLVFHV